MNEVAETGADGVVAISSGNNSQALLDLLAQGGPVVMILLGLSVITLAIALMKLTQYLWLGVWSDGRVESALAEVDAGRAPAALAGLRSRRHVVAQVTAVAIEGAAHRGADESAMRERVATFAEALLGRLRSELRLLELIGNISPLLGLLGTILGMIKAFRELEQAGSQVDPSLLSGGIWEALLTTAVGLAVAIPAIVLYTLFDRAHERVAERMEQAVSRVLNGTASTAPSERAAPEPAPVRPAHA